MSLESFFQLHTMQNIKKCKGNFITDYDGNCVLDLMAHGYGQYIGYNHDNMINARHLQTYDRFLAQNAHVSTHTPKDWADMIRENVMVMAPPTSTQVHLVDGTGSEANDAAIGAAF